MKRQLLLLLTALLPLMANAYDAEINGIYYDFWGDEATVTYGSAEYSGAKVIPSSVTYNSKTYSVTSIGNWAFSSCSGLTSVTIPNSVTSIGDCAFWGCSGLTSVVIPQNVTYIGNGAFSRCKLRNVLIKCLIPPSSCRDYDDEDDYYFSGYTYYHTTLYIPTGCWDAYAYSDCWYKFINIRETAMAEEEVSMQQAYTLMDANTFAYSVYDPVNDCIGTINSVSGIDENNPNHSWQVIEADGKQYLYNVGAKKFVVSSANGSYTLSDEATPINMEDGENGIILGTQTAKQWALVSNERMSVEQAVITGVSPIGETEEGAAIYNLSGQRLQKMQKGINIVGGRKVLIK